MTSPLLRPFALAILGAITAFAWVRETQSQPRDGSKKAARGQEKKANKFGPIVEPARLDIVAGTLLSADGTYDNHPAVAVAADGTTWVAWVRFNPEAPRNDQSRGGVSPPRGADEVVVTAVKDGRTSPPAVLSPAPGQYVRPVIAAAGKDLWCLWTATSPDAVASIWHSRLAGGAWSPAARLIPGEKRAHQNPEIAADPDGRVAVVFQVHNGASYDIALWKSDASGAAPSLLSEAATDDWDPAAAFDAKGNLHVAWSGFKDGDYDIYESLLPLPSFASSTPRRISARGTYDLHPWLAATPDGSVWASWDSVRVPRHGFSGRSTITGANLKGSEDASHGKTADLSGIEVRIIAPDGSVRIPGNPRGEIVAPKGYLLAHRGLAKIGLARAGEPWVVYRVLRRAEGSEYHWELMARPFRDGKWDSAVRFGDADGYLEEPGVATAPDGLRVAYSGEHRAAVAQAPRAPAGKAGKAQAKAGKAPAEPSAKPGVAEVSADHHRDFDGVRTWKGDIRLATVAPGNSKMPAPSTMPEEKAPADGRTEAYLPRSTGAYAATAGGKTYRLLWGDTHKHTNVSRCSQGGEPSPDDRYRYGCDIDRYDFLALSDHTEHPQIRAWAVLDYYWWRQQKTADLYHVPGAMSILYNYEWSMSFPNGHHNTIFPARPTIRLDSNLAASSTLAGGWKVLDQSGAKAITIPHTGADPRMGTAWEVQDDRYQRLCEIFQACRGSYEHPGCPREFTETSNKKGFYWRALEKGYHLGIICSSDHGYGTAYACVYAPENTRESIWQAMWDRRTYGSTTYGLVLEMHAGDHWMGEEWKSKEAPKLEVYVRGAAPIRSIEIIGRSKVLYAEGNPDKPLHAKEHRITWTDPDWADQTKEQWYYVRVIQTDDEMAWSSPVWITPQKEAN